ncbi:MAG: hypothetical protein ISS28_04155 [Candidatus Cloacimonetes bacterium]|nr:hypothetical protein [Candidatus Cloacimonadota bacterium]
MYKLIYQSVMGPEHILQDEKKAFQYLKNEMKKAIGKEKNLFVNIGLENNLVRVNLNVFKEKIGDAQKLFSAMKETAKIIKPNKSKLQKVWSQVGQIFANSGLHFLSYSIWKKFTEWLLQNNFPHISHSEIYRKAYLPSYRIVLIKFLINMSKEF